MQCTIERLLGGDTGVPVYFQKARQKWTELFEAKADASQIAWARWLTDQQIPFFEKQCGGREEGQEIMAWSGFGTLYGGGGFTDQNRKLAIKLVKAFAASTCSAEVKSCAKSAARSYSLEEEADLKNILR
jgi:hypothetical protein